ncbi:tyrosine--tRNA ligase [Christensenella sp. MSJ-20]|uniref:tyrosine--tRNA ligase n=1 Tax=Christensenella sp. MSJ-20 TaxID=2841518 RepID=UPI000D7B85BE|nr:MAG: tyrosine--tRNA ligase [Bacillota bacterium]QWT54972.1 tyrosine--tRNA ligase [Christensenella sp. MSJ-20]
MNAFDILTERGFIKQVSHPEIKDRLAEGPVTFYNGFDPTADSLHIGHFIPLMAMAHLQRAGHRPIVLVGGGTCMIGDPSGKTDMRQMMTRERIAHNADCLKEQMKKFMDFSPGKAIMVDNADWLLNLNYVEFIRDIGVHFSVNRMLTAECYKQRMERGLTFLEFNYMLMQSYDFLHLYKEYGCTLQTGGDDQWSNILSGADLIRRKEQKEAFALTFPLLTTSDGTKMGKTVKGALWLDREKTSPYEFYQYWRNIEDASVEKCLALLTFLPMDEVRRLGALRDQEINEAKKVLAFEITKLIHSEQDAMEAQAASEALFGGGSDLSNMPTTLVEAGEMEEKTLTDALVLTGLAKSRGDARRLVEGGGVYLDDVKMSDPFAPLPTQRLGDGIILRKGKKSFHRLLQK